MLRLPVVITSIHSGPAEATATVTVAEGGIGVLTTASPPVSLSDIGGAGGNNHPINTMRIPLPRFPPIARLPDRDGIDLKIIRATVVSVRFRRVAHNLENYVKLSFSGWSTAAVQSLSRSPSLLSCARFGLLTGELVGHARLIRSAFGGISHLWTGAGYRVPLHLGPEVL